MVNSPASVSFFFNGSSSVGASLPLDQVYLLSSSAQAPVTTMQVYTSFTGSVNLPPRYAFFQICGGIATPTSTTTPTSTATTTRTTTGTPALASTATGTRTSTATRTATATATATGTATATVTGTPPVPAPCAIGLTYDVPVTPGTLVLTLTLGLRFVVADAPVVINYNESAITIPPGNYEWQYDARPYILYSLTIPARILICVGDAATGTPTTPPTSDGLVMEPPCVPGVVQPTPNAGAPPDLAIVIPTLRTLATVTATIEVSVTVVVAALSTIEAAISTPAAAVETAAAGYSWTNGESQAASWTATIEPALSWLAILNPLNPAYSIEGGPLWALAPVLVPLLPIVVVSVLIAFVNFFLWLLKWLLAFIDLVCKLIELIPGE